MLSNGGHILLFPYPASGHIIPILDLASQLLARGLKITILVTPQNVHLLEPLLSTHPSTSLQTLILPFPDAPNCSSDGSTLVARVHASVQLSKPILGWFQSHTSPPVAIISDFFLGWNNRLASQLGVPRLVFWPSAAQQSLLIDQLWRKIPIPEEISEISFPNLPNSPVFPRAHVSELAGQFKEGDPVWEFFRDCVLENIKSWGAVYNSFRELEGSSIDHIKKEMRHDRVFAVGPLLPPGESLERGGSSVVPVNDVITWLDAKPLNSVVYVCFGSRVELMAKQTEALAAALEKSGVNFVWCVRAQNEQQESVISRGYEDRVGNNGLIIRGWAPQVAILRHRAVAAFLTHCGWNSTLEGIAAGVVMLTWPMGADQFANAKKLVDELGVAERACEGGKWSVPDVTKLGEIFAQSVSRTAWSDKRERALQLKDAAFKAVQSGGSSSADLDSLVEQLNELKCGRP